MNIFENELKVEFEHKWKKDKVKTYYRFVGYHLGIHLGKAKIIKSEKERNIMVPWYYMNVYLIFLVIRLSLQLNK